MGDVCEICPLTVLAEIDTGEPAGTIGIDKHKACYTVDPEYRGKGYATEMLK